jgi:hypothetical protein
MNTPRVFEGDIHAYASSAEIIFRRAAFPLGLHLNLHGLYVPISAAWNDHKISALIGRVQVIDLAKATDRIDDRRAGRVRHKCG